LVMDKSSSATAKAIENGLPSCLKACARRCDYPSNASKRCTSTILARGDGHVYLPYALGRKYPNAGRSWPWQYDFPAAKLSADPRTLRRRRHHISEKSLQNAVKLAVKQARISKLASCHTFRHSFATHLLETDMTSALSRNCWDTETSRLL
jgi:hypothetical protein